MAYISSCDSLILTTGHEGITLTPGIFKQHLKYYTLHHNQRQACRIVLDSHLNTIVKIEMNSHYQNIDEIDEMLYGRQLQRQISMQKNIASGVARKIFRRRIKGAELT